MLEDLAKDEIGDLVVERDGRIVGAFQLVPVEQSSVHAGLARPDGRRAPRLGGDRSGRPRLGRRPRADGGGASPGRASAGYETMVTDWRVTNLLSSRFWPARGFRDDVPPALPAHPLVPRIPIPSGSRVAVVNVAEDGVVLRPPAALRGDRRRRRRRPRRASLPALRRAARSAREAGRHGDDRRRAARAAAAGSAERPAPGGARGDDRRARAARRAVAAADDPRRRRPEPAGGPARARGARGASRRAALPRPGRGSRRRGARPRARRRRSAHAAARQPAARRDRSRRLRHRGRDGSARRAGGARSAPAAPTTLRASTAYSLLETAAARGWQLGLALERALAARVPVIGASLVLNPPRLLGRFRGYPYEDDALEQLVASPLRRFSLLPSGVRRRILQDLARELTAVAAFAGPPSVAHAEALLRGIARRSTRLEQPLDAIVIGMPWKHHHSPRERLNPLTVATVALGLALRLWRDAFPVAEGGTAIVLHRLSRHFAHGTQDPYRSLFHALRDGRTDRRCSPPRSRLPPRTSAASRPTAPAAPATRSCRTPTGRAAARARPARRGRDRRLPRPPGRAHARLRPHARHLERTRDGARPRRRSRPDRLLLGPPYFPLEVGPAEGRPGAGLALGQKSVLAEVRLADPLVLAQLLRRAFERDLPVSST